jgi:hypothetical protein
MRHGDPNKGLFIINHKPARNNRGGAIFKAIECLVFTPRGGENFSHRWALTPSSTVDFPGGGGVYPPSSTAVFLGGGLGVSPFGPPSPGSIRARPDTREVIFR